MFFYTRFRSFVKSHHSRTHTDDNAGTPAAKKSKSEGDKSAKKKAAKEKKDNSAAASSQSILSFLKPAMDAEAEANSDFESPPRKRASASFVAPAAAGGDASDTSLSLLNKSAPAALSGSRITEVILSDSDDAAPPPARILPPPTPAPPVRAAPRPAAASPVRPAAAAGRPPSVSPLAPEKAAKRKRVIEDSDEEEAPAHTTPTKAEQALSLLTADELALLDTQRPYDAVPPSPPAAAGGGGGAKRESEEEVSRVHTDGDYSSALDD